MFAWGKKREREPSTPDDATFDTGAATRVGCGLLPVTASLGLTLAQMRVPHTRSLELLATPPLAPTGPRPFTSTADASQFTSDPLRYTALLSLLKRATDDSEDDSDLELIEHVDKGSKRPRTLGTVHEATSSKRVKIEDGASHL